MTFIIPPEYHQRPLKAYLQSGLGLSSRLIARLKATEDGMLLDGTRVTVRAVLHAGSTLIIIFNSARLVRTGEELTLEESDASSGQQ